MNTRVDTSAHALAVTRSRVTKNERPSASTHADVRAVISHHSKSFALASRLLPPDARLDAQVLYAYCRRVDDAIDEVPRSEQPARLRALRAELDAVYRGEPLTDPLLSAFQHVVHGRRIPRIYLDELIAGMEMDVLDARYGQLEDLLCYCYRVAGTVGLMMCHVMGVRADGALVHAAHLGIAMQLTNIARDVRDDWQRGRLYLPDALLSRAGAPGLHARLSEPLPNDAAPALARATEELLAHAEAYYASGDAGLDQLSLRCAFGVKTARLVYADIGRVVRAQGCDPRAGRAVVSKARKLWLALRAGVATLARGVRLGHKPPPRLPAQAVDNPHNLLRLKGRGHG